MKKRLTITSICWGIVLLFCILCSCSSKSPIVADSDQTTGPKSESSTSEQEETSEGTAQKADEHALSSKNDTTAFSETNPQTLHFVDVYGQEYETAIDPNIAPSPYTKELFIHDGYRVSYDDPNYTSRLGVDVSYYQGIIDWEKVKAAGYEFAFIRIGFRGYGEEGVIKTDEQFHENIKNAQAAGLDVGVYFFAQAINEKEAVEEAAFVLEQLKGYELQMPVVYDPESILHSDARTDDVTGEQFTKNTKAFCETISAAGFEPMIYCNMLWQAFELDLSQLSEYPIWYADYEMLPQTPYQFAIWQYTQEGQVDGIDGNVDINIQMLEKIL